MSSKSTTKHRVQTVQTGATLQRLNEIQKILECASRTAAIAAAIRIAHEKLTKGEK